MELPKGPHYNPNRFRGRVDAHRKVSRSERVDFPNRDTPRIYSCVFCLPRRKITSTARDLEVIFRMLSNVSMKWDGPTIRAVSAWLAIASSLL
jgi:hypothetical protein